MCVSGIISLAQSGLDAITHETLDGDPTPVNIGFAAAGTFVGTALSIFVVVKGYVFAAREGTKLHACDERGPLLSGNRDGYST